jgi:hypothetical protein
MSRPLIGNDTKSSIFLLYDESNLLRCRQRTFGSLATTCCFEVTVFSWHVGQWIPGRFSGVMKCRKHSSTDRDSRRDPLSWASFDNGKERLMKGSDWIRLLPHLLHRSTDLRVPSKIDLIASGTKDQCESRCTARINKRVI